MNHTAVRVLVPALLVAALATGCTGGGMNGADNGGTTSLGEAEPAGRQPNADAVMHRLDRVQPSAPRSVIRTGNVELRADDVGTARAQVQRVVDRYAGQVSQEETTTGDDGKPAYSRMVLRIPTRDFARAMAELEGVAEFVSSNSNQDDVRTKVIDIRTRLRAQRRSVARITALFDRAKSVRAIMAIEAQLSRRQAALESLERQAAYLANQTSLSTITVTIDRARHPKAEDHTGFAAGFWAGWHGLTTFAVGLATIAGALIPWLVVLGVVGLPLLLVFRAVRRRRTPPPPEPTPADT